RWPGRRQWCGPGWPRQPQGTARCTTSPRCTAAVRVRGVCGMLPADGERAAGQEPTSLLPVPAARPRRFLLIPMLGALPAWGAASARPCHRSKSSGCEPLRGSEDLRYLLCVSDGPPLATGNPAFVDRVTRSTGLASVIIAMPRNEPLTCNASDVEEHHKIRHWG